MLAQLPDAGPAIQNDDGAVGRSNFNAGGIASVFDRVGARCRNGPACSPESYLHDRPLPPIPALTRSYQAKALPGTVYQNCHDLSCNTPRDFPPLSSSITPVTIVGFA